MSTPLSAPCLGQRGLSGSGAAQPAMATPASAPGQLQLGHRSPPSVGSPAGGPAALPGPAQAQPSNPGASAHKLGQHAMQHKRAAEPPASGQMQHAEVAQQWHCARCRQPLPAGATGSDGCKCDMVQPTKRVSVSGNVWHGVHSCSVSSPPNLPSCRAYTRMPYAQCPPTVMVLTALLHIPPSTVVQLNTGSSGRMHSRVEGLDEGQVGGTSHITAGRLRSGGQQEVSNQQPSQRPNCSPTLRGRPPIPAKRRWRSCWIWPKSWG